MKYPIDVLGNVIDRLEDNQIKALKSGTSGRYLGGRIIALRGAISVLENHEDVINKTASIDSVKNQRELLIAFTEHINGTYDVGLVDSVDVDDFIKSN